MYFRVFAVILAGLGSSACFVDLSRDESFLSVELSDVDQNARTVDLTISDINRDPIYSSAITVDPATVISIPTLSIPAGGATLEVLILDEARTEVEDARTVDVLLRPSRTSLVRLAYGEVERVRDPETGEVVEQEPPTVQFSETLRTQAALPPPSASAPTLVWSSGARFVSDLESVASDLQADLSAQPSWVVLERVVVIARGPDGFPVDLDELWGGPLSIRLSGPAEITVAAGIVVTEGDRVTINLSTPLDVRAYLDSPSSSRLTVSGTEAREVEEVDEGDTPEPPSVIEVQLDLLGGVAG